MPSSRRSLILSMISSLALAACGAGGPINSTGSNGASQLGSSDALAITTYTPASAPASSAVPITFTVNFQYDLETASTGTVTAGYQLAPGTIVQTSSSVSFSRGSGTTSVSFSLPASALTSTDLGVAVTLTDSTGAVLAQDIAIVPRG